MVNTKWKLIMILLELTNINKEENITRVYSFVRYDG